MKKIITIIFATTFFLNSCSLKPIISEKSYLGNLSGGDEIKLEDLGNGRVLFYNYGYYCPAIECGRVTKVNITANGISLGQINYGEYFIVELENGEYLFETTRKDVFVFKKKHKVKIDNTTKVIRISGNTLEKALKVTNILRSDINILNRLTN